MFLYQALRQTIVARPDNPAITTVDGERLNYSEFGQVVVACEEALREFELTPESRIGIYLPKHLLSASAPFAVSSLGCVFVPMNPLFTAKQVEHIVKDCDIKVLITSPDRAERLHELVTKNSLRLLLNEANPHEWLPASQARAIDVAHVLKSASSDLSKSVPELSASPAQTLAALLYTSGSTGLPKGVMVSHENLVLGALSVNQYLNLTERDTLLALLPFSFDYGLNQLISSVTASAHCVLFDYLFPQDLVKAISENEITGIAGVPSLWSRIVAADWTQSSTASVRYLTNSGGHLPEPMIDKMQRVFPRASMFLMYGLTEAFRSTYLPPRELAKRPGSIGIAIPNSEIFVINDSDGVADADEEGELVHRGPLVTMGYWRREEETASVYRPLPSALAAQLGVPVNENVVWSGDRVRRDQQGYLYFVGRRDAMIKTSGYRVSSEEIEEVLYAHEAVHAVAAIGVKDEVLGQAIIACVVVEETYNIASRAELSKDLISHCRKNLPTYLIPREINYFDSLPLNANHKIDRKQLVQAYESSQAPQNSPASEH